MQTTDKPETRTGKDASKYTAGPWSIRSKPDPDRPDKHDLRVTADWPGGEILICEGIGYDGDPQCEADARLIAAAPDLLAALAPFAELCDSAGCEEMGEHEALTIVVSASSMRAARAAITKAEATR